MNIFPDVITTEYIVSQAIGLVVLILTCISFFFKKDKLLIITAIANIILSASYFFLHAPAAAVGNLFAVIRCFVFYFCEKKYNKIPQPVFFISLICHIAIFAIFWETPYDIFELIVFVSFTYALILKEEWQIRSLIIVNKVAAISYNIVVFNYIGVLSKIIELVVVIITLVKFYKLRRKEQIEKGKLNLEKN